MAKEKEEDLNKKSYTRLLEICLCIFIILAICEFNLILDINRFNREHKEYINGSQMIIQDVLEHVKERNDLENSLIEGLTIKRFMDKYGYTTDSTIIEYNTYIDSLINETYCIDDEREIIQSRIDSFNEATPEKYGKINITM